MTKLTYERSLHLSLRGLLLAPDHFRVQTILGKLYALQGKIDAAIISRRMG